MPTESFEQLLDQAAAAFGIDSEYWDIWGDRHTVPAEVKQELLRAVGVNAGSAEELAESLARHTRAEWTRLLPPCLVITETEPQTFPINVPLESIGQRAVATIRQEDGTTSSFDLQPAALPQVADITLDGHTFVRKQVQLPERLRLGYHDISLALGGARAEMRYIVTPTRAWLAGQLENGGRAAGLSLSLYGVRSARNWGCGDFRDLAAIVDWVATNLHASFVGLNPLHAIHNRRPFNTSPYLPNCAAYQNFIYLDVEGIEDFAHSRRARRLREDAGMEREIAGLRASPFVEYERVNALKLRFLKLVFAQFLRREWRTGSPRAHAFREFLDAEGEPLVKFATYCALDEHLHRRDPNLWIWPDWPPEFRSPESAEVARFRQKHWRAVLFYQYLQWQIQLQLCRVQGQASERGMAIGLYHDLALATDRFGSDLWAHRPFFVQGCRVGSPPDDFSPSGQDWGFPPPNSEQHRENGYRFFADSIRKNCRYGGALRIDHVMRLFRLYWIPEGRHAAEGTYVRERSLDFLKVLALESVRNRVTVVGEDLGTVEPEVRETLARYGILSYRLFFFERDRRGCFIPFDQYPKQALVSSTTHDLPTLAGFWSGVDIESRRQAGVLDEAGHHSQLASRAAEKQRMLNALFTAGLLPENLPRSAESYPELTGELHHAIIGFLAQTPSALLAINQEDLTKETAQQNLPATTWQYPNWGRKMKFTIEELRSDPEALALTEMVRNWIARTGRTNRR